MADVEIDQSGRTDVLTIDTVLALSNGVREAILIPKSVKRECQAQLKARGMRKALIGVRLFSAGLVLSPAHDLAWRTLKGYRIPERRVAAAKLLEAC